MTLGALIDAGLEIEALREELAKLHLAGYDLEATSVHKNGLAGTLVDVRITESGVHRCLPDIETMKPFDIRYFDFEGVQLMVSRTGFTGDLG